MGMRALVTASAVLAAGVMTVGAGVTAASVIKPAGRVTAAATARGSWSSAATAARVTEGLCTAPAAYAQLAARLSAGIRDALLGRADQHAVTVYDTATGVSCHTNSGQHFASASIVKAIILAALLRWHQETGTPLSSWERAEATLMITESDNDAATALWNEVGMSRLQHFLDLAKMDQTRLGQDGYWGLTQVTAHDEMLLLELLTQPNPVLTASSRAYQLGLMARVIPSQRWGTPAGAPGDVTVHVKNGWLPEASGWHINSIGAFTAKQRSYLIAALTDDNQSEQYGIDTIEAVARVVHRDLSEIKIIPGARLAANVAPSLTSPEPSPWAVVPALPTPAPAPTATTAAP
jgi:beta-lactamase class A